MNWMRRKKGRSWGRGERGTWKRIKRGGEKEKDRREEEKQKINK